MPKYALEIRFVPTKPGAPVKQDETLLVDGKGYYYLGGRALEIVEAVKTILGLKYHVPHIVNARLLPDDYAEFIENMVLPAQDEIKFKLKVDKRGNVVIPKKR